MSNYLRRVTETVQDIGAPNVQMVSQQSATNPDKVVIGLQISQSTWDRALGAAGVIGFLGGVVYVQRWFKRWQKQRRLALQRQESLRAKADLHRHTMDTFHATRYNPDVEELVTHSGACHCQRVKFTVQAPAIIRAVDCSSSMGTKKGRFPYVYVAGEDFTLVSGAEFLSVYTFGTHTAKHLFCSVCGVHTMGVPRGNPSEGGISVNVHALDQATIEELHVSYIPGDHFVSDVEPAMQNRTSLSKGIMGGVGNSFAENEMYSGAIGMASRWLNTQQQVAPKAATEHVAASGKKPASTTPRTVSSHGSSRYFRPSPQQASGGALKSPQSSSLIQALVHGTAQAATSVAAAAGTLVDEITMTDDTGGNENAYFANRYASPIVPEVENHNALFHSSRASLPASFKSGKVDDVKNQLNRYLKRHISQDNGRIATPLKSSNRIF